MRNQVMQRLAGTVNQWEHNLQSRWGDPRVYKREEEQRARQDEAVAYDLNRRNSALLEDAYQKQVVKNRSQHAQRMSKIHGSAAKRPQSALAPPRKRPPRPS